MEMEYRISVFTKNKVNDKLIPIDGRSEYIKEVIEDCLGIKVEHILIEGYKDISNS